VDVGRQRARAAAVRIPNEQQRQFLAPLTAAEREQLAALPKRPRGQSEAPAGSPRAEFPAG
jgi:hypothetical protein